MIKTIIKHLQKIIMKKLLLTLTAFTFSALLFAQKTAAAIFNLMLIPGLTDTQAQNIYQAGFVSFQDIADAAVAELQVIPGFDKEAVAEKLLKDSQNLLKKYEDSGEAIPAAPVSTEGSKEVVSQMAKSSADQRLKEELAALEKNGTTEEKN